MAAAMEHVLTGLRVLDLTRTLAEAELHTYARGDGGAGDQWAQLHPAEWKRLVEIAPLKRRDSQPTR
jgi:hypothetical protein